MNGSRVTRLDVQPGSSCIIGMVIEGRGAVKKMTISEIAGQMGMVPWVKVEYEHGDPIFFNLAVCLSVELDEE